MLSSIEKRASPGFDELSQSKSPNWFAARAPPASRRRAAAATIARRQPRAGSPRAGRRSLCSSLARCARRAAGAREARAHRAGRDSQGVCRFFGGQLSPDTELDRLALATILL